MLFGQQRSGRRDPREISPIVEGCVRSLRNSISWLGRKGTKVLLEGKDLLDVVMELPVRNLVESADGGAASRAAFRPITSAA